MFVREFTEKNCANSTGGVNKLMHQIETTFVRTIAGQGDKVGVFDGGHDRNILKELFEVCALSKDQFSYRCFLQFASECSLQQFQNN